MSRPKHQDGPWESYNVRLRERDLRRLDEARGVVNRSEWTRGVLLAALEDADDAADADAAMEAPGVSVPLADVAAERPAPAKAPRRRGRTATRRIVAEGQAERAAESGVSVPEAPAAECGHSFPDVKFVAGARVCRKCG